MPNFSSAVQTAARSMAADGEPVVFYQPIYSLRDSVIVSLEALVRWRTSSGQILGAYDALSRARTAHERYILDLAILQQACADMTLLLEEFHEHGLHGLNVNLTPSSLVQEGLDVAVREILEESRLAPQYLRLEVPETAAFADLAEATGALRAITASGVSLTLDDVGVEAIGLRYLKTLEIDGLKIDRSFITRMLNGASDIAVVRLLVDLCAGLEIRLTAEGVERCEQVDVARSLGVRAIQGYHISRPVPLAAVQTFIRGGVQRACLTCFGPAANAGGRAGVGAGHDARAVTDRAH